MKCRILTATIALIVLTSFIASCYLFSIVNHRSQQIIQTVKNENYLQEVEHKISMAQTYQLMYASTHNDTALQLFNSILSNLDKHFSDTLYNNLPQYAKELTSINAAIQEKIDLLETDSLLSSGNASTDLPTTLNALKLLLQKEREQYSIEKQAAFRNAWILFIIAFTTICILLWYLYKLMKTKGWACNTCENKILIQQFEADNTTKSKIDFLSMVLDEIRSPMNSIISTTSLFLRTDMTEEQRIYASRMRRHSVVLLAVVNDILDLSKIESRTFVLENTPFILKDCIDEALSLMSIDQQQLQVVYDTELPDVIESDPSKLRQIWISILAQIVNLSKNWQVVLNVDLLSRNDNELNIGFKLTATSNVKEEAKNIPSQDLTGGLAVGLSISARLVSVMGGTFKTEALGISGSKVAFNIKAKMISGESTEYIHQKNIQNGKVDAELYKEIPLKILIADNDPITQILLASALLKMGYSCIVAQNGEECLQLAVDNKVDLIFIDSHMPGMSGLETTEKIRHYYMDSQSPVIVATTTNPFYNKKDGLDAGINDYLVKPFKPKDIEYMIKKWGKKETSN